MNGRTKRRFVIGFLLVAVGLWFLGSRVAYIRHLVLFFSGPAKLSPSEKAQLHTWLKKNTVSLDTVEAGSGFEDMQPLKAIVGNARIVALGEASHLNREFYQVKHRMVEFLVEEMDFSVFAIEASFAGALELNDYILTGDGDPQRALAALVYPAWITEEILALVNWMREYNSTHENKVKFYGFDNNPVTGSAKAVYNYLRKIGGTNNYDEVLSILMNPWTAGQWEEHPKAKIEYAIDQIERLICYLEGQRPALLDTQRQKELSLVVQHARVLSQYLEFYDAPSMTDSSDLRDHDMAENVRWIMDYEAGAKMILWAANPHVVATPGCGGTGEYLRRTYGKDMVVFGLLYNRKSLGYPEAKPSPGGAHQLFSNARADSVEAVFAEAGLEIAILDLRSLPRGLVRRYFNSPLKTGNGPTSVLPMGYDALLFIESTTSARPIGAGRLGSMLTLEAPSNLDFEQIEDGRPKNWKIQGGQSRAEYQITGSHDQPYKGSTCGIIKRIPGRSFGEAFGNIMQFVKASDFPGKRMQLGAAVRVSDGVAYLWLSIDMRNAPTLFRQQEITSSEWQKYRIAVDVPREATRMTYGLAYVGQGAAFIDDVSVVTGAGVEDIER
jgi:erythromycin esterase